MTKSFLISLLALASWCVAASVASSSIDESSSTSNVLNRRTLRNKVPRRSLALSDENQRQDSRALSPKDGKGKSKTCKKDPFDDVPSEDECIVIRNTYTVEVPANTPLPGKSIVSFPGCGPNPLIALATANPPATDQVKAEAYKQYKCCLEEEYAIQGKWWFHRDDPNNVFTFKAVTDTTAPTGIKKDAACSKIVDDPAVGSPTFPGKGTLELWDKDISKIIPASDFVKLEVDYNVVSPNPGGIGTGTQGFVSVYMLDGTTTTPRFFDCRFTFLAPAIAGDVNMWKTLTIEKTTALPLLQVTSRTSGGSTGCQSALSIGQYITATNGKAVFGVNNGEDYAFVFVTGGTGENNSGLEVCWSEPTLTFTKFESVHKFTPVPP